MSEEKIRDMHIMIAADGSRNSQRAVEYVAGMLGGLPGFRLTILRLTPLPPEEHFASPQEKEKWLERERESSRKHLGQYRDICLGAGFPDDKVETRNIERHCPSVSDCIIEEVRKAGACTLVVGRRGVSLKEEFLFGSTSSQVLHDARGCAVWVVE